MSTSKSYLEYILDSLSGLEDITYKSMMGEYIVYYRKKIAVKNKIKDYKGTPEQNEKMLRLLKSGKLIKP